MVTNFTLSSLQWPLSSILGRAVAFQLFLEFLHKTVLEAKGGAWSLPWLFKHSTFYWNSFKIFYLKQDSTIWKPWPKLKGRKLPFTKHFIRSWHSDISVTPEDMGLKPNLPPIAVWPGYITSSLWVLVSHLQIVGGDWIRELWKSIQL